MTRTIASVLSVTVLLTACGTAEPLANREDQGSNTTGSASEPSHDTASGGADTGNTFAAYWGVEGTLVIQSGGVDAAASQLRVERRVSTPGCIVDTPVTAASPRTPPAAAGPFVWWDMRLAPRNLGDTACDWVGGHNFYMGLGPTDPLQNASALQAGLDIKDALGLWISHNASTAWLVGLALPTSLDSGAPDTGAADSGTPTDTSDTGTTDSAAVDSGAADTGATDTGATGPTTPAIDGTWGLHMLSGLAVSN